MRSLIQTLKAKKIVISDGAIGTILQARGLQPGECPELWNITHRSEILTMAKEYIEAGSDMILTNSFGANSLKLKHFGLQDRVAELNRVAAQIAREAAGDDHLVFGSIGPTGVIIMMGDVSEEEIYDGYFVQTKALKEGGVDGICVETMSAIDEAAIAIRAARDATGLEVACTFTFEKTLNNEYRTMMGVTPEEMVKAVKAAGANIIGTNCGNGIELMIEIVKEIRKVDNITPVIVHSNAGKPIVKEGRTIFPETPEFMASKIKELIEAGANIVGGCCGTTPEHIKAIAKVVKSLR